MLVPESIMRQAERRERAVLLTRLQRLQRLAASMLADVEKGQTPNTSVGPLAAEIDAAQHALGALDLIRYEATSREDPAPDPALDPVAARHNISVSRQGRPARPGTS